MIPNLINTLAGLVLAYAVVLNPIWIERRFFPLLGFAAVMLVMALWARRTDAHPWFSSVNIVLAILLGVLAMLPLAALPFLTFWTGFWVGCAVPVIAFWAVLYRPKPVAAP